MSAYPERLAVLNFTPLFGLPVVTARLRHDAASEGFTFTTGIRLPRTGAIHLPA